MISGSHSVQERRREDNEEGRVQKEQMTNTRQVHVRAFLPRFSHTPHFSIQGMKSTSHKTDINTSLLRICG